MIFFEKAEPCLLIFVMFVLIGGNRIFPRQCPLGSSHRTAQPWATLVACASSWFNSCHQGLLGDLNQG